MALIPTIVKILSGSGAQANIAGLTDGTNTYLLHATVDANGNTITPAQDATLQTAATAMQSLVATLSSQIKTDPGTF